MIPKPIDYRRFRPNLLVSGDTRHDEDKWQKLRIGEATFSLLGPCERCKVTTIDPDIGEFSGPEPLKTINQKESKPGLFGQFLGHSTDSTGKTLEIGMDIFADELRREVKRK